MADILARMTAKGPSATAEGDEQHKQDPEVPAQAPPAASPVDTPSTATAPLPVPATTSETEID